MIHSFLLIGQSNMSGRGLLAEACEIDAKALYEFGLRYFEVFDSLRDPAKAFNKKCAEDDAVKTDMEQL